MPLEYVGRQSDNGSDRFAAAYEQRKKDEEARGKAAAMAAMGDTTFVGGPSPTFGARTSTTSMAVPSTTSMTVPSTLQNSTTSQGGPVTTLNPSRNIRVPVPTTIPDNSTTTATSGSSGYGGNQTSGYGTSPSGLGMTPVNPYLTGGLADLSSIASSSPMHDGPMGEQSQGTDEKNQRDNHIKIGTSAMIKQIDPVTGEQYEFDADKNKQKIVENVAAANAQLDLKRRSVQSDIKKRRQAYANADLTAAERADLNQFYDQRQLQLDKGYQQSQNDIASQAKADIATQEEIRKTTVGGSKKLSSFQLLDEALPELPQGKSSYDSPRLEAYGDAKKIIVQAIVNGQNPSDMLTAFEEANLEVDESVSYKSTTAKLNAYNKLLRQQVTRVLGEEFDGLDPRSMTKAQQDVLTGLLIKGQGVDYQPALAGSSQSQKDLAAVVAAATKKVAVTNKAKASVGYEPKGS